MSALISDRFNCPHPCGKARISYRACLIRQRTKVKHRVKVAAGVMVVRMDPADEFCANECATGRRVAKRFDGVEVKLREALPRSFGSIALRKSEPLPIKE